MGIKVIIIIRKMICSDEMGHNKGCKYNYYNNSVRDKSYRVVLYFSTHNLI